ncbi:Athe_2463 domain-containing protein [Cytobacillus sp. IB215665]|uniref:Athe_2463 domain-containing protein n=1 Tax=Cytobacillus sp. IB215665 TaxID=3097357 RepID=UPI002A1797B7|nr:hypothetical protein [Cytobacillus sp. IB215665]MDX8367186.1 hypothetical protein [Cytobacillus sp. IB215665]
MNKPIKIAMVLSIMAILIMFVTIFDENNQQQALAGEIDDYSDAAQDLIEENNIPLENYDGYPLNESMLLKYGMIVYGDEDTVINNGTNNDVKDGESRYLGYDADGNLYQNYKFPHDYDATGDVDKDWIKTPWEDQTGIDKGINEPNYDLYPGLKEKAIELLETMLDPYDPSNQKNPPTGRTWLEAFNALTGENWTAETLLDYAVIHNFASELGQGSVTLWNRGGDGNWWYQTFIIPPLDGFVEDGCQIDCGGDDGGGDGDPDDPDNPTDPNDPDIPVDYSCSNNCGGSKTSAVTFTEIYTVCETDENDQIFCYEEEKDYYEYLSSSIVGLDNSMVQAGFGFTFQVKTSYTNQYFGPDEAPGPTSVTVSFPASDSFLPTSVSLIPENPAGSWENTWTLPEVYVEKFSGNMFYSSFDPNRDVNDQLLNGGKKWFTPFKQPDGAYDFTVKTSGAGTEGLYDCKAECVLVKGSPFDDYVVRLVRPDNPFPSGVVGENWQGNEWILHSLTDWYYKEEEQGDFPIETGEWMLNNGLEYEYESDEVDPDSDEWR